MALVKIANVSELKPGEMKRIEVDSEELALYNVDGAYYVTSDICTHARVSLTDGTLDGSIVSCPKHGGKFNVVTGKAVAMPAFKALQTYPVEIRGEDIYIDFEE
jgi:3-phenylpropionate/trans-cinnamate dioxygenase ferredoxin component